MNKEDVEQVLKRAVEGREGSPRGGSHSVLRERVCCSTVCSPCQPEGKGTTSPGLPPPHTTNQHCSVSKEACWAANAICSHGLRMQMVGIYAPA